MPRCYFLGISSGSALDQGSNNVSLFNLIEQLNIPVGARPPPNGVIPVELHAYWMFEPQEVGRSFQTRHVLVSAGSGLELPTEVTQHQVKSHYFRTRSLGLPFPAVTGEYTLRVDWRSEDTGGWVRDLAIWPLKVVEVQPRASETVH